MVTLELQNISKTFFLKKERKGRSLLKKITSFLYSSKTTKSLTKEFKALDNINLKFYENEIVGIIGINGAGKSTLANIMYGLTKPSSGKVITNRRIVALFGFGSCFNQELTGRENIYLNGTAYGLTKKQIDYHIDEIIAFSEIDEIDIQLKFYSNGMKARLGFSIVAYIESDILILDEALVGGDVYFQKKCVARLKEIIARANKSFIIISHSEGLLKELCTKIIVMKNGKIEFESNPISAIEFYKKDL
jgi:ABC-type polysaccharide/polyol phosphate transport system ATPase subunit